MKHEIVEKNIGFMVVAILIVISFGGLVEIVPLFFQESTNKPVEGLKPLNALQLEGRDIYVREGCYTCHSQMIRPFRAETERYGHYSVAGESVYDHPFQWGSKRTGPDLARVGGRYSDDWHYAHLINPRDVVPESVMPAYSWMNDVKVDGRKMGTKMSRLRMVGVPYTDEEIAGAEEFINSKPGMNRLETYTEMDAVVAYLQQLGTVLKDTR